MTNKSRQQLIWLVAGVSGGLLILYLAGTDQGRKALKVLWEGDEEAFKKKKAMKKLDKINRSLEEVANYLEELANDAKGADTSSNKEVSAYYHFASDGTKFKSKWDTFDVDKALDEIDSAETGGEEEESGGGAGEWSQEGGRPNQVNASKILNEVAQVNHNVEKLLGYLDQVRGDEAVKARRREVADRANDLFGKIDDIKAELSREKTGEV